MIMRLFFAGCPQRRSESELCLSLQKKASALRPADAFFCIILKKTYVLSVFLFFNYFDSENVEVFLVNY